MNIFSSEPVFPFKGLCHYFPPTTSLVDFCGLGSEATSLCYDMDGFSNSLEFHQSCEERILKNLLRECFGELEPEGRRFIEASTVTQTHLEGIPGLHVNTICSFCGWELNKLVVFEGPSNEIQSSFVSDVAGVNRWRGFFSSGSNPDTGITRNTAERYCVYTIRKPVFVFNLLQLQVGHFIIDVLEPLYNQMKSEYGEVVVDSIIFFDIMDGEETRSRQFSWYLKKTYYEDSMFKMLRTFSSNVFFSKHTLEKVKGRLCFDEINVQLRVDSSFSLNPAKLPTSTIRQKKYQSLSRFLFNSLEPNNEEKDFLKVTFLIRTGNREIINLKEIHEALNELLESSDRPVQLEYVRMETKNFTSQVALLNSTDVFICQQGTGFHNVLFMHPSVRRSMLLIMNPGWCDFHFQFSHQALLQGFNTFVLCSDINHSHHLGIKNDIFSIRLHKKGYKQGPYFTKYANYSVNIANFRVALNRVFDSIASQSQTFQIIQDMETSPSQVSSMEENILYGVLSYEKIEKNHIHFIPEIVFTKSFFPLEEQTSLSILFQNIELCISLVIPSAKDDFCFNASHLFEYSPIIMPLWTRNDLQSLTELIALNVTLHPRTPGFSDVSGLMGVPTNAFILKQLEHDGVKFAMVNMETYGECAFRCLLKLHERWFRFIINQTGISALAPQPLPTIEKPFIFYHVEKSGGTCFRKILSEVAREHQLTSYLPCHNNVSCLTFSPEASHPVIGGHFNFDHKKEQTCLIWVRHPVSRFISYYYERFYPLVKKILNKMSSGENLKRLEFYVRHFKAIEGAIFRDDGFSNTLCKTLLSKRKFSGTPPTREYTDFAANYLTSIHQEASLNEAFNLEEAQERLKKCFVGVTEEYEASMTFARLKFPWMNIPGKEVNCEGSRYAGPVGMETMDTVAPTIKRLILDASKCDMKLYELSVQVLKTNMKSFDTQV
eukprot:snap_masked-scaffold_2-processed-gene-10.34-mRNA-1 protein AED:1.00 eAED:1.00 QI:0/0/0/0/1/1/2/0/942